MKHGVMKHNVVKDSFESEGNCPQLSSFRGHAGSWRPRTRHLLSSRITALGAWGCHKASKNGRVTDPIILRSIDQLFSISVAPPSLTIISPLFLSATSMTYFPPLLTREGRTLQHLSINFLTSLLVRVGYASGEEGNWLTGQRGGNI